MGDGVHGGSGNLQRAVRLGGALRFLLGYFGAYFASFSGSRGSGFSSGGVLPLMQIVSRSAFFGSAIALSGSKLK